MKPAISPAYWPLRILLAIGVASVAVILVWALVTPLPDPMSGGSVIAFGPLALDALAWRVLVVGVPIVGLALQVRIFRALRDAPPSWRHRDRKPGSPMDVEPGAHVAALLLLAIGIELTVLVVGLALLGPTAQPCLSCERESVLGLPGYLVINVVAICSALIGAIWMVRIFLRMP